MNAIIAWIKSKNISSHTVAVAIATVATIIVSDQQARDMVLQFFHAHPQIGTAIVALSGIYLKYSGAKSDAGIVAAAEKITEPVPGAQALNLNK